MRNIKESGYFRTGETVKTEGGKKLKGALAQLSYNRQETYELQRLPAISATKEICVSLLPKSNPADSSQEFFISNESF